MASTRRVMNAIQDCQADRDLVFSLLAAPSAGEAAISFTLLRDAIDDRDLLMLANLREVLGEIPEAPFRTGEPLEVLERAAGYEATGRSYRRLFESAHGVFGVEFMGEANTCAGIVVHTAAMRYPLCGDRGAIDETLVALFVHHAVLLDAVLEGLELLGCPLDPRIYVTTDDFLAENAAAGASKAFDELF